MKAHAEDSVLSRHPYAGPSQSPAGIDATGWKSTLKRTKDRVKRDRVTMAAGSLAYHWFLAFFPAIIAALGVLTLVSVGPGTVRGLTHGIARALPSGSAGVFQAAVTAATRRSSGSASAVAVGILVALWSASSGMAVMEQALDVAYEVPTDRKFLARRLVGLPLMAVVAVVGGCAAVLVVFGQPIGSEISGALSWHGEGFVVAWTVVRWVFALALLTALFSAIYHIAPNRQSPRWRWVTAGGVFATLVFLAASLGFSFYVSSFGSYAKTYGSFAGVAILIFWMWLIGLAVLVGGELNAEIERQGAGDRRAAGERIERMRPATPGTANR